ncbi:MAG TPA: hypothetical protein VFL91_07060, partial [Thermomicrobiales bacterium]|nr:hypothetical protein [Thermomicrobiales bacterium]
MRRPSCRARSRPRAEGWLPAALGLLVGLAVLGPALRVGSPPTYLLRYDLLFVPRFHRLLDEIGHGELWNHAPLLLALEAATATGRGALVERLVLVAIPALAFWTAARACAGAGLPGALAAGALYAANPVVYERLAAGEWTFLLGYALAPLVWRRSFDWVVGPGKEPAAGCRLPAEERQQQQYSGREGWRAGAAAVGWWLAATLFSAHHAILLGVLLALGLPAAAMGTPGGWRRLATLGAADAAAVAWWALPGLAAGGAPPIGAGDFLAFAPAPIPWLGTGATTLGLYGFWRGGVGQALPWERTGWVALYGLLLALVAAGIADGLVRGRGRDRRQLVGLALAGLVAFVLAYGPAPPFAPVDTALFLHLPGFRALRESGKWTSLLPLLYAAAFARLPGLAARAPRRPRPVPVAAGAALALALFVVAYSPSLWWGLGGQWRPVAYPPAYARAEALTRADPRPGLILPLPWDRYVAPAFGSGVVLNPARDFFTRPVLLTDDPGLPGVPSSDPRRPAIDRL